MPEALAWLEATRLARTVGESLPVTAWLSAAHLVGFTLVMSAAVVWNLHATGFVLRDAPAGSIAGPSRRLLLTGLAVSLVTGVALFSPRATSVAMSGAFQLKITLLLIAATFQLTTHSIVLKQPGEAPGWLRYSGAAGLSLWLALALAACWFILFE